LYFEDGEDIKDKIQKYKDVIKKQKDYLNNVKKNDEFINCLKNEQSKEKNLRINLYEGNGRNSKKPLKIFNNKIV